MAYFRSGFLTSKSKLLYKKICSDHSNMTHFAESSPKERDMIPKVMQPSPKNNIKIVEIDKNKVIHTLIMNNIDEYKYSSR